MPAILTNRRTNEKAHFRRLEALLKLGGRRKPDVVLNKVENCFLPHPVEWTKPMQTNLSTNSLLVIFIGTLYCVFFLSISEVAVGLPNQPIHVD